MTMTTRLLLLVFCAASHGFVLHPVRNRPYLVRLHMTEQIISPFDDSSPTKSSAASTATTSRTTATTTDGPLDLTWENVEYVLDEMRPYLIQDGGNVAILEIDGPVVRLELQVRYTCAYRMGRQNTRASACVSLTHNTFRELADHVRRVRKQ